MTKVLRLSYTILQPEVLPEVLTVLDDMIALYNDWDGPAYLKLWPAKSPNDATSSRYQLFQSKELLFNAIVANCPTGCSLKNE